MTLLRNPPNPRPCKKKKKMWRTSGLLPLLVKLRWNLLNPWPHKTQRVINMVGCLLCIDDALEILQFLAPSQNTMYMTHIRFAPTPQWRCEARRRPYIVAGLREKNQTNEQQPKNNNNNNNKSPQQPVFKASRWLNQPPAKSTQPSAQLIAIFHLNLTPCFWFGSDSHSATTQAIRRKTEVPYTKVKVRLNDQSSESFGFFRLKSGNDLRFF